MMKFSALSLVLSSALLLAGCASKTPTPSQYSGFLSDYSQLQPAQSASGAPVMRWVSADFNIENYRSVLVERPQFYPAPTPHSQVSQQTLDDIALYLQQAIRLELAGRLRVVEHADRETLVFAAAASTAAGTRDLNTEVYVELEAIDGRTSQPMTRVVRKGHGLKLENDSTQLQLKDIKPALDTWAQDARLFKP
jgi:hypothetical protein